MTRMPNSAAAMLSTRLMKNSELIQRADVEGPSDDAEAVILLTVAKYAVADVFPERIAANPAAEILSETSGAVGWSEE